MGSRWVVDFQFAAILILISSSSSSIFLSLSEQVAAKNVSNSSSSDRELKALMDFGWPTRNSTTHHCQWSGVNCDDDGRVTEISLQQGYTTEGRFHKLDKLDVLAFPSLTRIHLSSCGLYGTIPPQIGYLSQLTYLNLSHNLLQTELPLSLANLTRLRVLDISDSSICYGVIPPEIGSLSELTHINLSHNHLEGELPLSLANLTKLQVLDISHNYISGVIPPDIANLSKLTYLSLSNNHLWGELLPLPLSNLTQLRVLDISHNDFISGAIPPMSRLKKLQILNLGVNKLEGVFEAGIEKLPAIKMINLSLEMLLTHSFSISIFLSTFFRVESPNLFRIRIPSICPTII